MQRQEPKVGEGQMISPMGGMSVTVKSILPEDVCGIKGGVIISENKPSFGFGGFWAAWRSSLSRVSFEAYGFL
jgi:hypothetical protein